MPNISVRSLYVRIKDNVMTPSHGTHGSSYRLWTHCAWIHIGISTSNPITGHSSWDRRKTKFPSKLSYMGQNLVYHLFTDVTINLIFSAWYDPYTQHHFHLSIDNYMYVPNVNIYQCTSISIVSFYFIAKSCFILLLYFHFTLSCV